MRQSARSVAVEAIRRVTDEGAYSTIVIPGALRRSRLDARDRAFATELAYGTIRRVLPIDRALGEVASRPVHRMTPSARAILRLGAYQVLCTDVPSHAAVGETVALARDRERGFVNAVLRRLEADPPAPPSGASVDDVSARTGLATWAVAELGRLLPGDEVEPAARAFAMHAPLSLRANTATIGVEGVERGLRAAGLDPRRSAIDPTCLLVDGGDPSAMPGYAEGSFAVQDEASAFVVRALDPRPGERVLDACAAPGGKAVYASTRVGDEGLVVAADAHPGRIGLVRRAAERLGVDALVVVADARSPAVRGPFDRVLVDAPCSGLGSARRRPELLWRDRKDQLSRLAKAQVAIVASVADLLTPGGRLVYSVCTFPRAETDAAADAIVRHRPDLVPTPIDGPDGEAERIRLWPHRHGSDGMFVAAFTRAG